MSEKAKRYNEGKAPLSRILEFKGAVEGAVRIMDKGDQIYGRLNWQNGHPHTEVADSLLRHLLAWMSGEDVDPKSGELHLDHVTCNSLMLAYHTRYNRQLDDRSPAPGPVAPASGPPGPASSGPPMPPPDGGPYVHSDPLPGGVREAPGRLGIDGVRVGGSMYGMPALGTEQA